DPGAYRGLTYIKTDINDANETGDDFLSFIVDENAIIYVAYEKTGHDSKASTPGCLNGFKKEDGEIVAQYRYFSIYSKNFAKGKVTLAGADAKANHVASNYFIMIKAVR